MNPQNAQYELKSMGMTGMEMVKEKGEKQTRDQRRQGGALVSLLICCCLYYEAF
jgi:hypothetical protein